MIQTVDRSKHYCPENKIFLDVPAALKIFDDKIGIVQHVKELTKELCDSWNDKYFDQPQASLTFTKNRVHIFYFYQLMMILIFLYFKFAVAKESNPLSGSDEIDQSRFSPEKIWRRGIFQRKKQKKFLQI
jgi:hypothetical protein